MTVTLDSTPATLVIEVEIATVWTNISTDYTIRNTVKRDAATAGGKPAQGVWNVVQRAGGLAIHEGQRVRVQNPDTAHYIFRGYIDSFIGGDAGGNEKLWQLTCTDASQDLDNYHLPQGYIVAVGTSDQTAITAAFTTYCPAIAPSGINLIITSLAEIDASYMTMRQFLVEVQKQANGAQKPDYMVSPDALGDPQLTWFDFNNNTHAPVLSVQLVETTAPDATHCVYENFQLHRDASKLITKQTVYNPTFGAEGTIDGAIDRTAPHTFTGVAATDVFTTSTNHGLTTAQSVYVESTGTLPAGLAINTEYWIKTTPAANTLTLARRPVVGLSPVGAEPSTDRLWYTAHGFAVGDEVVFSTTGTLPAPLVAGTRYYVKAITENSFTVSATNGGAVIDITDEGTGVHTVTPGTLDITSTGSGTHTLYDVRFDQVANDAYDYLGYQKAGEPFKSDIATTNHEARLLARSRIHALGGTRVTVTLDIRSNIDPSDLGGPRKVLLQNTLWGLATSDPAWPIVRSSLDFSEGIAVWHLELGDRFVEYGDNDLVGQLGLQRLQGDTHAPAPPTWPVGFLLENAADTEHPGYARLRVMCSPNTESDMFRYWFRVQDTLNAHTYDPAPVYHSVTEIDLTPYSILSGVNLQITVRAEDTSGNMSNPSVPVSVTTVETPPSDTLFNPGYEIPHPFDATRAFGWVPTVAGGGVVARNATHTHSSSGWALMLDSSSGIGGTASSAKSRYRAAQGGVRHRIAVWAIGAFAGNYLTLKGHWYDAAGAFISATTLVTNAAVTTSWQQYAYSPVAPTGAAALKVEPANNVAGGQAIWVDDWDVQINPPTPTFYNGSFEIRAPGTALPDGYTFAGDAQPALTTIHVRDGQVAFLVTQGAGQTLTTTSTPMLAQSGRNYSVLYSITWDNTSLNGTDFNLIWRDSAGVAIGSPTVVAFTIGASSATFTDANKGPFPAPANTASVELQMVTNAPSSGTTNTFIDRLDIIPTPLEALDTTGAKKGGVSVDAASDSVLMSSTGAGGIKLSTANGTLVDSALALTTLAISVWPYTAVASASVIDGTTGATNRTLNLPAVAGCPGRLYLIKKVDSGVGTITIDPNSTETIDGASTLVLSSQYASVLIQSNGTEWKVRSYYRGGVSPNVTATAPIKTTTTGDNVDIGILAATTGAAGSMSAADKTKLDGIGTGASVSSVALTVPSEFSVSGSPVTGAGTLAVTKANQSANLLFAGPTSGGAAAPTFRAVVAADIPASGVSAAAYLQPNVTIDAGGRITVATSRAGTSFPGSPSNNDPFLRTDLGVQCRYISAISSWVGPPIYEDLMKADTAPTYSVTTIVPFIIAPPDNGTYYFERVSWRLLVATTNTGLKYWTYRVGCDPFSGGGTVLVDVNSSAKSPDVKFMLEGTGFPYQPLNFTDGNQNYIWIEIRKDTGTPGPTTIYACHLTMYKTYT